MSSEGRASLSCLPEELLCLIVDQLRKPAEDSNDSSEQDLVDVKSLCLVAKAFVPTCQRIIFEEVVMQGPVCYRSKTDVVWGPYLTTKFAALLEKRNHLAGYVHILTYRLPKRMPCIDDSLIIRALESMVNVTDFTLAMDCAAPHSGVVKGCYNCTIYEPLDVEVLGDAHSENHPSHSVALRKLMQRPTLQHLRLRNVVLPFGVLADSVGLVTLEMENLRWFHPAGCHSRPKGLQTSGNRKLTESENKENIDLRETVDGPSGSSNIIIKSDAISAFINRIEDNGEGNHTAGPHGPVESKRRLDPIFLDSLSIRGREMIPLRHIVSPYGKCKLFGVSFERLRSFEVYLTSNQWCDEDDGALFAQTKSLQSVTLDTVTKSYSPGNPIRITSNVSVMANLHKDSFRTLTSLTIRKTYLVTDKGFLATIEDPFHGLLTKRSKLEPGVLFELTALTELQIEHWFDEEEALRGVDWGFDDRWAILGEAISNSRLPGASKAHSDAFIDLKSIIIIVGAYVKHEAHVPYLEHEDALFGYTRGVFFSDENFAGIRQLVEMGIMSKLETECYWDLK